MHLKMSYAEVVCCKYLPNITDEYLYMSNQRKPRSDCSYRSSLIWVHTVCQKDFLNTSTPARVAQSVTCLATDACLTLTADPGVASSIPAGSHTFVEIDHELTSMVILLPSDESFKKGCCQFKLAQVKCG